MKPALRSGSPVDAASFRDIVRTMALEHHKWDAQVGDTHALARFPVVLSRGAWAEVESLASALAAETVALEQELVCRPDLHAWLGLPPSLARLFRGAPSEPLTPSAARIMRFDFHPTADGWSLSEVNSDVPGGFTEASRFASLVGQASGEGMPPGDPGDVWMSRVVERASSGQAIALLCAPGWLQDTQVVTHLASRLRERGLAAYVVSPHQLRWKQGVATLTQGDVSAQVSGIVRFYQAEWIARLTCEWRALFVGGLTPVSNPVLSVLTESKRLPLVWSELDASAEAWRKLLPETRDPRQARFLLTGDWVLKPAYGNEGDDVVLAEQVTRRVWGKRALTAWLRPKRWVAQRRFEALPLETPDGPRNLCLGVYVVDGLVCGAYGRITPSAVIDFAAIDAAVLVDEEAP